ncbi:hypothetical protein KEM60_01646 [Austwickia sp. TVS 96-490-7B]|nr:hypothetical protein [Austwickia sp. TVS 96-490-7B]
MTAASPTSGGTTVGPYDVHPSTTRSAVAHRARDVLQRCPNGTVLSHHTAATLWGLWTPHELRIHVAVPGERYRPRRVGIAAHRLPTARTSVQVDGLPVTSVLDTLLDLAAVLSLPDLVAAVDRSCGLGLTDPSEVARYAHGHSRAGVRMLRRAAQLADGRSESAMESRTRVLLCLAGYPQPESNPTVTGGTGRRYRLDLVFWQWSIAVEYDGRHHAENSAQYASDLRRREDLQSAHWQLVTAVAQDVYGDPEGFLDRLDRAIRAAGGTPPRRRRGWQAMLGRR